MKGNPRAGGGASSSRAPTGRGVAESVLARVLEDAAFAAAALEAAIEERPQLDPRDRALATELVYGALRTLPWLEAKLDAHAKRSVTKLRPRARAALAIGAYQLLLLDRVPPHAAVNAAVDAVRASSGERVAAFANAVLRKVAAEGAKARVPFDEAARASVAPWLREALEREAGAEGADALLGLEARAPEDRAGLRGGPAPIGLRVPRGEDRATWLATLRAALGEDAVTEGLLSPYAVVVHGKGRPRDWPGVREGTLAIQEEGSQVVALALGARPGERILDACAGRGHKTALLALEVGPEGRVDAADLHPSKLERLRTELPRGGAPVDTYAVDWSVGSGDVPGGYDAVLVDAPCSGTGTLRRRPDILLRRRAADVEALASLQVAILRRAAGHVRPGGRLVYAVCSVLHDEGEAVIERAGLAALGFREAPFAASLATPPGGSLGRAARVRLFPHVHGTDGYFLSSFVRDVATDTRPVASAAAGA